LAGFQERLESGAISTELSNVHQDITPDSIKSITILNSLQKPPSPKRFRGVPDSLPWLLQIPNQEGREK